VNFVFDRIDLGGRHSFREELNTPLTSIEVSAGGELELLSLIELGRSLS
jgi:mannose-6-phosphate isomerase-like protein (cupin superfamily)